MPLYQAFIFATLLWEEVLKRSFVMTRNHEPGFLNRLWLLGLGSLLFSYFEHFLNDNPGDFFWRVLLHFAFSTFTLPYAWRIHFVYDYYFVFNHHTSNFIFTYLVIWIGIIRVIYSALHGVYVAGKSFYDLLNTGVDETNIPIISSIIPVPKTQDKTYMSNITSDPFSDKVRVVQMQLVGFGISSAAPVINTKCQQTTMIALTQRACCFNGEQEPLNIRRGDLL
jgi:hypothetical protein